MKFPAFPPIDLKNKFGLVELSTDQVFSDPNQPRKYFSEPALLELSQSIQQYGVLQPIVVRKIAENHHQIIAGERRWRASKMAAVRMIPAIVKEDNERDDSAIALVENIQREALNPMETARAFSKLSEEHQLSHDEIAKMVGKSRAAVTNTLRLLNLSETVQNYLMQGQLEMGHARTLLMLPPEDQITIANKIISDQLSVRSVEKLVKNVKEPQQKEKNSLHEFQAKKMESALSSLIEKNVSVKIDEMGRGKITFSFLTCREMDDFFKKLEDIYTKIDV